MRILAVETSAGPASCAVVEDGRVIASSYNNTAQTHSQTLMPMVEAMLEQAALTVADMDRLVVSAGPGSFTGVRIGVAALKGLAFTENKPCVGVSTLAAIARNAEGVGFEGVVCAAMDARCRQVYTACFLAEGGKIRRLSADEAISTDELKTRLAAYNKPIFLVGDGARLCYNEFCGEIDSLLLAPEHLRFQTAVGVAREAQEASTVTAEELQPLYLRLPQAERELRARQQLQG
ncbi:MAG: tRNA (adenosine(37)-N6)-threonylcarbamoyltransferase complex dimerization subunit type 1 TsaB [Ruminococcaceae bacterium]|nr:tRNA (adenosine(37)-N6)-threonylcarbamoyltransferase complex dimerization subunit type 1 TsaB [Oscillospiraceae bacterium]